MSQINNLFRQRWLAPALLSLSASFLVACGGGDEVSVAPPPPAAISFANIPPPPGTDPLAGATNLYHRSVDGSRHSPFDIEISLFNASGKNITTEKNTELLQAYKDVYQWKYPEWQLALATLPPADSEVFLRRKRNAFWETSAQDFAERIFGLGTTSPVYKFGPVCAFETCAATRGLIADADRIVIKTTVKGDRDPLNPVTRTITFSAKKATLENPDVTLELVLPADLRIASPQQEILDFRPAVAGSRTAYKDIRIVATLNPNSKKRVVGFDYPDFNLFFVPMRHLVFQGAVLNPKGPQASLTYATEAALLDKFQSTAKAMYSPTASPGLVTQLTPFLTADYYYMFGTGVQGYASYILSPTIGIGKGLGADVATIDLFLDGRKAISVAQ